MKYMIVRVIRFYDMEKIICVNFIIKYTINLLILPIQNYNYVHKK